MSLPFPSYFVYAYHILTQDMLFSSFLYVITLSYIHVIDSRHEFYDNSLHTRNNVTNISAPRVLHFSAIHYVCVLCAFNLFMCLCVPK